MATLEIVQVGDPVLRRVARPVTAAELASPELRRLVLDMRDTMRAAPGVGLAAPQIGVSLRLVVIEDPAELQRSLTPEQLTERERKPVPFHVLINPTLTITSDERIHQFEGCLSFATFHMVVPRARSVRVEALDEHGQAVVVEATGWYARILQHEVDHLDGVVCCDRMEPRTLTTPSNYTRYWAEQPVAAVRAALDPKPR